MEQGTAVFPSCLIMLVEFLNYVLGLDFYKKISKLANLKSRGEREKSRGCFTTWAGKLTDYGRKKNVSPRMSFSSKTCTHEKATLRRVHGQQSRAQRERSTELLSVTAASALGSSNLPGTGFRATPTRQSSLHLAVDARVLSRLWSAPRQGRVGGYGAPKEF